MITHSSNNSRSGRLPVLASIFLATQFLFGTPSHAASGSKETGETPAERQKAKLGDKAASLAGLKFIKGEPVEIEDGKIYIVEFWATWCAPCIRNIPHLTKLQAKYRDKGLTVIGISAERDLAKVKNFVAKQGKRMDYTVAVDAGRKVGPGYMRAYGRKSIPSAFVVDQAGKVVWEGHPGHGGMDEVIELLVNGSFDLKTYTEEQARKNEMSRQSREIRKAYFTALRDGKSMEESRKIVEKLFELDSPEAWSRLSWGIIELVPGKIPCDYELALKAAQKANEATGGKDPDMLDGLAHALVKNGRVKEAIKLEKQALNLTKDDEGMQKHLREQLDYFLKLPKAD